MHFIASFDRFLSATTETFTQSTYFYLSVDLFGDSLKILLRVGETADSEENFTEEELKNDLSDGGDVEKLEKKFAQQTSVLYSKDISVLWSYIR